jgi:hypothetical protein
MSERNCLNKACGKPLTKRQKKYCSAACQYTGRRSPKADKIWEMRLANPQLTLVEIAEHAGASTKYVDGVLYSYPSRPKGLIKRHYKPRQKKPKPAPPEPLPTGKYGKHVAPGWLWGGADALEKQYPQFAPKKDKK